MDTAVLERTVAATTTRFLSVCERPLRVDSGLPRPQLDFQHGNLLCGPERPGSAKAVMIRTSGYYRPVGTQP